MTRKHYQAIARILAEANASDGTKEEIGEELAAYFATDNRDFRPDLFLAVVRNEG